MQKPQESQSIKARHAAPADAPVEPMEEDNEAVQQPAGKARGRQASVAAHPAELIDASEVFSTGDDVLEHYARHGNNSAYKFVNCNR